MLRHFVDFIAFRTTKKYNTIKIRSLVPGYYDKDTLFLHAAMQLVVDFVEIECSWMELDAPYTWRQWLYFKLPWFLHKDELIRNRELGLKHLDMLASFYTDKLKDATDAPKIVKDVYLYWKDIRPQKIKSVEELYKKLELESDESRTKYAIDTIDKLEADIEKQDTKMLKKIVEVRGFLWT
jgi:hypothetical protein